MDKQQQSELEQAAILARREYQRKWRAANKDKVRESNRRYWEKRAQREMEAQNEG